MADLTIADVSEFQGQIDWPNYGSDAVICRINYGNDKVDAQADRNIDGARSRCKARGWYTYLVQSEDPVAQADVLIRVLQAHGGLQPNEFIVCDDEEGSGDQSGRVTQFLNEVDAKLNAPTSANWWYSGLNFSIAHNMNSSIGHRWIAAYGQGEPSASQDMWQYTDAGSMAGIAGNVDLSVFHGDINQFIAFLGGTPVSYPRPDPSWWGWPYVSGATLAVELPNKCHAPVLNASGQWFRNNTLIGSTAVGQFAEWILANQIGGVWYDMDESGGPSGAPAGRLPVDQSYWITDAAIDTTGCGGTDPISVATKQNGKVYDVTGGPPVPPTQPAPAPVPAPVVNVDAAAAAIANAQTALTEALKALGK